jgi:hypothetical protein
VCVGYELMNLAGSSQGRNFGIVLVLQMQNTIAISEETSVEPLTPAHLPYVLQLLPQVLDPNPLVRNPASNELIKLESRPNYCSILLVRNKFYSNSIFYQMDLCFSFHKIFKMHLNYLFPHILDESLQFPCERLSF